MNIVTKFFVIRFHEVGQQALMTGAKEMIKPVSFTYAERGRRGLEFRSCLTEANTSTYHLCERSGNGFWRSRFPGNCEGSYNGHAVRAKPGRGPRRLLLRLATPVVEAWRNTPENHEKYSPGHCL
jgi:hypothetical protein